MKILRSEPKNFCGEGALDDSRFGNHVKAAGLEQLGDLEHGFVIVGFDDDTGIRNVGGRTGAASGPEFLRQKLYKFTTGKPSAPVYDLGDLPPAATIASTHEAGARIVKRIHEAGHSAVVIGGGHDLGYPHALGFLQASGGKKVSFLNIDAHLDVRPVTHGITSGSPWFLLREHPLFQDTKSKIEEFGIQEHCNATVLVEYAARHKFGLHWLRDLPPGGRTKAWKSLLRKSGLSLVSLDIDSVQWSDAPGCSAPQTLGFTATEAVELCRLAGENPKVRSFGLFELSPPLDADGRTATLAAHCIKAYLEGKGVWRKEVQKGRRKR